MILPTSVTQKWVKVYLAPHRYACYVVNILIANVTNLIKFPDSHEKAILSAPNAYCQEPLDKCQLFVRSKYIPSSFPKSNFCVGTSTS
jgi:hypothetical protein